MWFVVDFVVKKCQHNLKKKKDVTGFEFDIEHFT